MPHADEKTMNMAAEQGKRILNNAPARVDIQCKSYGCSDQHRLNSTGAIPTDSWERNCKIHAERDDGEYTCAQRVVKARDAFFSALLTLESDGRR